MPQINNVSANTWMWHYLAQTFSGHTDINHVVIKRISAHVVNFYMLFACSLLRRRFGYAPFRLLIKFSTIHVYARTWACSEKAVLMYFGRISLEHVLGMIDFPQIVQTMNRQVICAELSASSPFYVYCNNAV